MTGITVTYSYSLIAASLTISIVASYAALCFAERISRSIGRSRISWLGAGSLVLGLGIWSMHYLGMLAVHLSIDVAYSLPIVLVSLALAVLASAVALQLVSKERLGHMDLLLGSITLGGGIGAMHYTGMASMRSCSMQHYSVGMVLNSILVALVCSWISLSIAFRVRDFRAGREWIRVGGAVLMGGGIAAMHYTAMAAVTFMPVARSNPLVHGALDIRALGGLGVAATISIVLIGALLTALLDRVTYQNLSDAHLQLVTAHGQLAEAQTTLLKSEEALWEANQRLVELSVRDGLTKLYNRRYLDDALETEWRQATRSRALISMLMIDVDFFKAINDEYGHSKGDETLQKIAATLTQSMEGSGSLIARFGGEEFAIVLPCMPTLQALSSAEHVRRAVFNLRIPNQRSSHHKVVTVSIGLCSIVPGSGDSLKSFVSMADQALYRAKALGRNRIETLDRSSQIAHPAEGVGNVYPYVASSPLVFTDSLLDGPKPLPA